MAERVRGHWAIEHALHCGLDSSLREDDSRTRTGDAPENVAMIRHIALTLLKREKTNRHGMKVKRNRVDWDKDYLLTVLGI